MDIRSFETLKSLSFGMMMIASTFSFNCWMPCSAWTERLRPSKVNGLVTTPIVRAPRLFAISATTGAAPVPVPPPLPAVMKTMSAPTKGLFDVGTVLFSRGPPDGRDRFRPRAPSSADARCPA